jgi:hypothetical protein
MGRAVATGLVGESALFSRHAKNWARQRGFTVADAEIVVAPDRLVEVDVAERAVA